MRYDITKNAVPTMPTLGKGTECIKLLLSQASKDMHEPLVPMFFPILGAHVSGAEFQYPDLTWKELCGQMANLVADSGGNKGQLSHLVEAICRDFRQHDKAEMKKVMEWQKRQHRSVVEMVPDRARVIDIGCGDGTLLDVLREEKAKLEAEIAEATDLLLSIQDDLENRQAEFDAIMAEEAQTEAAIDRLVAQLEAERAEAARRAAEEAAAAAAQNGGGGGGSANATGSFVFPVASYVYISSRFGERVHPITGELKHHNGMDIAANMGTAVYAADGGKVVLAEWYGGYGNCIMIDHGNGYKTLYGHLSSIGVSEGQSVSQGAVIGAVGSTGNSTGPHLHFEVYANDSRIDPEQFYSGLNISADAGV